VICGEHPHILEVGSGTPLGAMSSKYRETEFDLLPGETMVLYTDGLTEARRGADFFGEQGLVQTLTGQDCSDVQGMVDALISRVTDHAKGRLHDDLAIIALRLTPAVFSDLRCGSTS